MPTSMRLEMLKLRISKLRHTFLPSDEDMDPTGTYHQEVFDKTTAFRLIAHAEFESYLEDIVKLTIDQAFLRWKTQGKVSLPLLCIAASYEGSEKINAFSDNSLNKKPLSVASLLHKAYRHFEHNLGNNNGIRTKNILAVLIQAGIEESDLDATWIGSIDAFGAHRNVIGHKSSHIAYQADPKEARDAVNIIYLGFNEIDERLSQLRRSI